MARPALSASRGLEILDFLASFPARDFTLSEIARAAHINVASCHAVVSAMVERGYLARCPREKTYRLGPTLVAVGQAALKSQPLIARAQTAAEELHKEFGIPVMLSAVVGDEILGILAIPDPLNDIAGLRVGERLPLIPPVGAPFLAWASPAAVDAWLAKVAGRKEEAQIQKWRDALSMIRKRGYQVALRSPDSSDLAGVMARLASGREATDYRERMVDLIGSLDDHLAQPQQIVPDEFYDLQLIAAPIFDEEGEAAFNLCLGGFADMVRGSLVQTYADRLVRTCVQIMREHRNQGRAA